MRGAFKTLICGGLLWTSVAFAVSRVGGGTVSNVDEGLQSLQVPGEFQQKTFVFPNGDVTMQGPVRFVGNANGFLLQESINLYLLRNQFPSLAHVVDRQAFTRYFLNLGWTPYSLEDPCESAFIIEDSSGYNIVVGWGDGQGVLLAGANAPDVTQGIQSAVGSIRLMPGACAWK